MELYLTYNGTKYEVKKPTISMYQKVMKFKDLFDEDELIIRLLSEMTGLTDTQIKDCPAEQISVIGNKALSFLIADDKKPSLKIEHNGTNYSLMDINNISFGQFVDIDTFLSKDENYKLNNLHELAAYLYIEEGTKYGETDFKKRKEAFLDLPIKELEGAVFFLTSLGAISVTLTEIYSKSKILYLTTKMTIALISIGDGIPRFPYSPKTKFGKLLLLPLYPLWLVLITLHTLWMSIKNKIKK